MNTIVIEIAGVLLLLSSLVSLIFLLKRNFKQCKTSPLYVLVVSDILTSVLISILLFFNQYKEIIIENSEVSTKNGIMNLLKKNNTTNEKEEKTVNCELQIIIMNYALFLIPFANSFISLLSMSIQYSCHVEILHTKCRNLMNFQDTNQARKSVFTNLNQRKNIIAVMSVASQWIIPILSVIVLLFAGDNRSVDIPSADMNCVLMTNFPFENCYSVISDYDTDTSNSTGHLQIDKNNYINELALERFPPNSSVTDEVVSKVYGIVDSALESTGMQHQRPEGYYGSMQLLNVTNFMKIPDKQNDIDEVKLFEDLMKNVSSQYVTHISNETLIITSSTEIPATFSMKPINVTSDAQIFNDIVQKINRNKFNVKNKIKPQFSAKGRLYMDEDYQMLIFDDKIDEHAGDNFSCLKNQCFISKNFLKIHLFLLMIFIYFGPILLSTILNIRTHYVCSNALEKLDLSERMILSSVSSSEINSSEPYKPSKFRWFGPKHDNTEEGETSKDDVQVEQSVIKDDGMRSEAEEMEKLSRIFRKSLISGVISWSPMFLQVLMKVFLCSDLPMWLTHFFYLMAISYGAVRNYFNMRMLRSSRTILTNGFKKTNIIHPTAGLSTSQPE